MKHKLSIFSLILTVCLVLSGCSNSSKECDNVNKAQQNLLTQTSAHLKIISNVKNDKRNETITTDFIYTTNAHGTLEYSETQMDATNKMIFCEMNDGEKAEHWLLGKGWAPIEPTAYTKNSPHRYLSLLTTKLDNKMVERVSIEETEGNQLYTFCLNSDKLNKEKYSDTAIEVVSEELTFLVNASGSLLCYTDNAVIFDKQAEEEANYSLEIQVSEQNSISEIAKPELRANAAVEQDIVSDEK